MYFHDAARCLEVNLLHPDSPSAFTGVSIDTRTLQPGNLFVAIRGEKDDGHRFLGEAFKKKAAGALIDRRYFESHQDVFRDASLLNRNLLAVEDTTDGLVQLATAYRLRFNFKTAGITGSVGKTSTKEFLFYLLRQKFNVLANEGNLNNHLGLPITLFRLRPDHEAIVAELGANHKGEIRFLSSILKPQFGMITRIAPAHLGGFGSLDSIYDAKSELFEALPSGATAVLPDDDRKLLNRSCKLHLKLITVGFTPEADYRVSGVSQAHGKTSFLLNDRRRFSFPGLASFLARNAAMAIALAEAMGVGVDEMPSEWADLKLPSGRFEEQIVRGIRMIFDGYNASPYAFDAALDAFAGLSVDGRRVLVFSDMLELGSEERKYHELLGLKIANSRLDAVLAYGSRAEISIEAAKRENPSLPVFWFNSPQETGLFLNDYVRQGDTVLLKASRSMKIEEVQKILCERLSVAASS